MKFLDAGECDCGRRERGRVQTKNTSKGQRIPMCRRNGVSVMRMDEQPCQKTVKSVRFSEEVTNEGTSVFNRLACRIRTRSKFADAVRPRQASR